MIAIKTSTINLSVLFWRGVTETELKTNCCGHMLTTDLARFSLNTTAILSKTKMTIYRKTKLFDIFSRYFLSLHLLGVLSNRLPLSKPRLRKPIAVYLEVALQQRCVDYFQQSLPRFDHHVFRHDRFKVGDRGRVEGDQVGSFLFGRSFEPSI